MTFLGLMIHDDSKLYIYFFGEKDDHLQRFMTMAQKILFMMEERSTRGKFQNLTGFY